MNVSTEPALRAAIGSLAPNTTILIADGTYSLSQPLQIKNTAHNVTIRGASGNREAVILTGGGMTNNGTNLSATPTPPRRAKLHEMGKLTPLERLALLTRPRVQFKNRPAPNRIRWAVAIRGRPDDHDPSHFPAPRPSAAR